MEKAQISSKTAKANKSESTNKYKMITAQKMRSRAMRKRGTKERDD